MAIKAIIFDIGGVVVNESGTEARNYIAKKYKFSAKLFWEYTKKNLNQSYKGKLDAQDFFDGLITELKLKNVRSEDMITDWLEIREKTSRINKVIIEDIKKLKENYLVGTLSNSTFLNEQVNTRKTCYGLFSFNILSCNVGFRKPEPGIYKILVKKLTKLNIDVSETIFVGDRNENLIPARELGLRTILFKENKQMIQDLRKLDVKI